MDEKCPIGFSVSGKDDDDLKRKNKKKLARFVCGELFQHWLVEPLTSCQYLLE